MKTNYVLNSNRVNKSPFSRALKVVVVLALVISIIYTFFPRAFPVFFTSIFRPLWGDSGFIEELRKTLNELYVQIADDDILKQENDDLKKILGRVHTKSPLLATILKKPPFSAYDTFILDVGVQHKIKKGQKVYAFGDVIIGEIGDVIGNTSKVKLYSSAGEKFTVSVGSTNIETVAIGKGGGYFELSLPRGTKIIEGDSVVIPSLTSAFVGRVGAIVSDPSEPFLKVLFRQPLNIYELKWVIVDTNDNN